MLTGINEQGDVFLEIAGLKRLNTEKAYELLAGKVLAGSIIATDQHHAYSKSLKALGVKEHLSYKSTDRSQGTINLINALHSRLKEFLRRFKGVSSRRLFNYLMWFKWIELARRSSSINLMSNQILNGRYVTTWRGYKDTPYPFDLAELAS